MRPLPWRTVCPLLRVLVQQIHEAPRVLSGAHKSLRLLQGSMLFPGNVTALGCRSWMTIALAVLGIALKARERLREILKRQVLQEHPEAYADIWRASSAPLPTCALRLTPLQSRRPLHQRLPEVRIVQILLE